MLTLTQGFNTELEISAFVDICSLSMRAVNYRPSYIGYYISMGPSCRSPVGACQSSDIYCIKSCAELLV